MFAAYSWVEINIYMYVKRTSKDCIVCTSLQKIADEFNITKGLARHAVDKLVDNGLLKKATSHEVRTISARFPHSDVANNQSVTCCSRTIFARSSHDFRTKQTQTFEERKHEFGERLIPFLSQYGKLMIRQFFDYWTETSPNGTKMRFEKESTFEVPKRLARWKLNNYNYNNSTSNEQRQQDERQQRLSEYAQVAAQFAKQAEEDLRSRQAEDQDGFTTTISC